ncbi:MAG TPA: class I SAM-dependent methyltransferase [Acetobacteraceae bacterium]|nr:class I SAM-dependent methyltransferase [Acetobacteraceae bacterium]
MAIHPGSGGTAGGGRLTSYRDRYRIAAMLSWLPLRLGWVMHLFGSDKESDDGHSYGATYHELLRGLRYRPIRLLEIGVLSGDSLLGWRAFLPRATIVGCDIRPKPHCAHRRIRTYVTDQSSAADLAALAAAEGPFDVIIDDGSHISDHQITSFYALFDHLRGGGLYVIEDVQTSFWPGGFGGAHATDPAFLRSCMGEMLELAKYINQVEFRSRDGLDPRRLAVGRGIRRMVFEHNLVIVWKRGAGEAR